MLDRPETEALVALGLTLGLQLGHVAIHLANTMRWHRPKLPWYDAWVGYLGALTWFIMVILTGRGWSEGPEWIVLAGLVLTVAGLAVHGMGIRDLVRYRDEGPLVQRGIYARVRHPIYAGWVIVSFGLPLLLRSDLGLLTAPLWSGVMVLVAVLEERDLARALPEGVYEEYRRRTWL